MRKLALLATSVPHAAKNNTPITPVTMVAIYGNSLRCITTSKSTLLHLSKMALTQSLLQTMA